MAGLFGVLRPVLRSATQPGRLQALTGATAPMTVAELEGEMDAKIEGAGPGRAEAARLPALTKRASQHAEQRPEQVAQLVQAWIAQEDR
jgi:flagellar biosynthesis/type III secretory pathway M-ring protein FliF/YscJ